MAPFEIATTTATTESDITLKVLTDLSPTDAQRMDEVLVALRRLIRATDLHSKHLSKTAGLTAPQLLVLQTLKRLGEVTVGDIGRSISLSQATVTTIVNRLERRGYLVRERSVSDRRKVYVRLTPGGDAFIVNAPTALQERFIRRFANLESWEQSMILSSLQRVAAMMDAEDLDASPVLDIGDLDRNIQSGREKKHTPS